MSSGDSPVSKAPGPSGVRRRACWGTTDTSKISAKTQTSALDGTLDDKSAVEVLLARDGRHAFSFSLNDIWKRKAAGAKLPARRENLAVILNEVKNLSQPSCSPRQPWQNTKSCHSRKKDLLNQKRFDIVLTMLRIEDSTTD